MPKVKMEDCKVECFDETIVSSTPLLLTRGISTCIAIVIQGSFADIPYRGLYHWSGFKKNSDSQEQQLDNIFSRLALRLQEEFGYPKDEPLPLSGLYVIGGEKVQFSDDGEMLVSGTEAEIEALQENAVILCQQHFDVASDFEMSFHNYLTEGIESLAVSVYPDKIDYGKEASFLDRKTKRHRIDSIVFGDNLMPFSKKTAL